MSVEKEIYLIQRCYFCVDVSWKYYMYTYSEGTRAYTYGVYIRKSICSVHYIDLGIYPNGIYGFMCI